MNFNRNVQCHRKTFISEDVALESTSLGILEAYQRRMSDQAYSNEQKRYQHIDQTYRKREQLSAIAEQSLGNTRILNANAELFKQGKELVFKDIMTDFVYESLYLDDSFKAGIKESLYEAVTEYVDSKGGFMLLEAAIKETNSSYLKQIKHICEATARKCCQRKLEENDESIDFSLNAEEEKEFNYDKAELNIEELSALVKEKVLTTVKDEQEREKEEANLIQDLADETNQTPEEVEEAMRVAEIGKLPVYEGTLFNALLRDSYGQYIKESVSVSDNQTIDMDVVLAEAITKYTILEVSHTIQLESFGADKLRQMVQGLLNK